MVTFHKNIREGNLRNLLTIRCSFLPPDRVFGRIKKDVKKNYTILLPSEYRDIFKQYAAVLELDQNFSMLDWKAAVEAIIKPPDNGTSNSLRLNDFA